MPRTPSPMRVPRPAASWLLGLGLLVPAAATAGVPVLHDGTAPDAATTRGARFASVSPQDVELHTIEALAGDLPPFTAQASPLRTCTQDQVPEAHRTAEALRISIRDVLHDEALDIGGRLLDLLPCWASDADRHDIALAWFRYGYVLALERQHDAAREAFSQAVVFDPTLTWDPDLAPDGSPTFANAKDAVTSAASARLTVSPRPAILRVDGVTIASHEAVPELRPGWHVVELGTGTSPLTPYAIQLAPGAEEALVVPALVDDSDLPALLDGDILLSTTIDRALPPYAPAWAVAGRRVYTRPTAGAPWKPASPSRHGLTNVLHWTAIGALGTGAALLGVGSTSAVTAARDIRSAQNATQLATAEDQYDRGRTLYFAGWGAVAVGGLAGGSAVLFRRTW